MHRPAAGRHAALTLLLVGMALLAGAAAAQTLDQLDRCSGKVSDTDNGRIAACTVVIASGRILGRDLAVAYANRGDASARLKAYDQAISDYNEAVRLDPRSARPLSRRAYSYLANGDVDRATTDINAAIRIDPRFAPAYSLRGLMHYGMARIALPADRDAALDRAIADYTEAVRLDPDGVDALLGRAKAYADKNDTELAIADYDLVIRIQPENAKAFYGRGVANNLRPNGYDRAIADYSEALRLDPNYRDALDRRGWAYMVKRDYDNLILNSSELIRLDPSDAEGYYLRGYARRGKGEYNQALADFDEAIRLDPMNAHAYDERGLAHEAKGQLDVALDDFSEAIRVGAEATGSFAFYEHRAHVLRSLGDMGNAAADDAEAKRRRF